MTCWHILATDGSSDEGNNFSPVLVRHVDRDPSLIATSLLETPNINSNSTPQQSYDVCIEVREEFSFDWDNF